MGFHSFSRALLLPFAVLTVLATTTPAAAADYVPYHRLRAVYPQIDRAVAAMPSAELHGSFNRISAQLSSHPLRSLPEGSSALVPSHVEHNLVRAIDDLRTRLGADVDALAAEDRLALLQTIAVVVFQRIDAVYSDADWEFCPDPGMGCLAPPVLSALDRLAQDLIPVITGLVIAYQDESSGDPSLPAAPPLWPDEEYNSQTFASVVSELSGVWGYVHGEPSIE